MELTDEKIVELWKKYRGENEGDRNQNYIPAFIKDKIIPNLTDRGKCLKCGYVHTLRGFKAEFGKEGD